MGELLQGLLDSPLNIALAVGGVAALVFLFLPKEQASRVTGAIRAWAANLGADDGQPVKPAGTGPRKSVLVTTRLGRLLGAVDRVNALQSELDGLGMPENEYTQGLRDQLAEAVEHELVKSVKGVTHER